MTNFEKAYISTTAHEGGYSNHMRDAGGETWKGISRKNHPAWEGWKVVDDARKNAGRHFPACLGYDAELERLTRIFYFASYWQPLKLEAISDAEISAEVFDTAVNQGLRTSARYLQEALNTLNNNQQYYANLVVDGNIGPKTLQAYAAYMSTACMASRSKDRNIKVLLKVLNGLQFMRYYEIVQRNEAQEVFFYGWVQRT